MKTARPWTPTQSSLTPHSRLEWLPQGHLAYFILDALVQAQFDQIKTVRRSGQTSFRGLA